MLLCVWQPIAKRASESAINSVRTCLSIQFKIIYLNAAGCVCESNIGYLLRFTHRDTFVQSFKGQETCCRMNGLRNTNPLFQFQCLIVLPNLCFTCLIFVNKQLELCSRPNLVQPEFQTQTIEFSTVFRTLKYALGTSWTCLP